VFKNYFKTAFRNLKRNKSYAIINVLGLTVGIAASVLIFLVIQYETSFDNFHKKKDSIYRLATEFHTQDGVGYSDGISFPAAPALRIDFPQIKEVAAIYKNGDQITIEQGNAQLKKLNESNFYYA
jgi:putative ABC transport system permease protein